jgi:hypothetical protein
MPPVNVDNPSKNLNPQLSGQSSGQSSAGPKDPFEGVIIPDSPSGAAQFSAKKDAGTAGSHDLKVQKAQFEANLKTNQNILQELVNQRPELSGYKEILQKYENHKPSWQQIASVAKKLLAKENSQIPILPETTQGAYGAFKKEVVEDYKLARKIILKALSKAETIGDFSKLLFSLDGDGNIYNKTLIKTQNSDSSGSLADKLAIRLLIWVSHMLNGQTAVNSQRVSIFANMSVQGSEGEEVLHKGKLHPSFRTVSQISDCFDEVGIYDHNDPLFGALKMIGLGSAVVHEPGKILKLNDKVIQFSEIIDEMNKTHKFLDKFNEVIKEKGLRVLEFKSLPEYLTATRGESKLEDYLKFTELTEKAFKQKWTDQKYAQELKSLDVPMSGKHKELLAALEDPNNKDINLKTFSAALRYGKIVCLVPHAIDPYNILDEDSKLKLVNLIVKTLRSPEIKDFLASKYSFPKDQDIFNINNISVSHIDFSGKDPVNTKTGEVYTDFNKLADALAKDEREGRTTKATPNQALKIIANTPNPYLEFTTATNKEEGLPSIEAAKANNQFIIGGGDSPSDKSMLAHALLAGGAAFVARGQIDFEKDLGGALIDHLVSPKYQGHEFALRQLDKNRFQFINTGEELDRSSLAKKLIKHYSDPADPRIVRQKNVCLNDAAFGGVMLELAQALNIPGLKEIVGLKDPTKFSLEVNENAPWVKQFQEKRNVADISTPLIPGLWESVVKENEEKGGNLKTFSERSSIHNAVAKIPLLGSLISMEKPAQSFRVIFNLITAGLLAGGLVAGVSTLSGNSQGEKTGLNIQKWTGRLQAMFTGVSLYLMTPHKFTLKPFGKLVEEAASFLKGDLAGALLGPISNMNIGGVAIQAGQENCLNIDEYLDQKDKDPASKKAFKNPDRFYNIRVASSELTDQRRKDLGYFKNEFMGGVLSKSGILGEFAAGVIPDIKMWLGLSKQFFTEPGLQKGVLKNLLPNGNHGIGARMGKNNGMQYVAPHSEPHIFAATAFATVATSLAGAVSKMLKADTLSRVFAGLANVLPSIALVNHAKTAALNINGEMTRFTDRHGEQRVFSPQAASGWQISGAYLAALGGAGLAMTEKGSTSHKLHVMSQILNKVGWGVFFNGLFKEFGPIIDNNEITAIQHQGKYIKNQEFNQLDSNQVQLVTKIAMGDNAANNIARLNPATSQKFEPKQTVPRKEVVAVTK